ncbi:MAG: S8 family serine peptidase [Chloroflexota bacterium]
MSGRSFVANVSALVIILLIVLLAGEGAVTTAGQADPLFEEALLEGAFVPNEVLIGLEADVAAKVAGQRDLTAVAALDSLRELNRAYGVQQMAPVFPEIDASDALARSYGLPGILKLTVPPGTDIFELIAAYQAHPDVAYAEPNRIYSTLLTPNDPDFDQQWSLHNTGQTGGTADADIDAVEAWDLETGHPSVLIAIIDTGVDYTHEDLDAGRVRTDIDRDFYNGDDDAMDDHGHGTFVAAVAAGDTNNGEGIAGICHGCRILPVKVLSADGQGSAETVAQGIQYAADAGAQILNMSLGFTAGCGCSQTVATAINYAFDRGSLLVAASGNDSNKGVLSYPAASPRVMSVGSSNHNDQESDFSNFSAELDIMAPGEDIYSLELDDGYLTASGTSAASPHVAGVAGLVLSANPSLTNAQLWHRLYQSADDFPLAQSAAGPDAGLWPNGVVPDHQQYIPVVQQFRQTAGRLNAYRALRYSHGGGWQAAVDTCSGEPDGCVPGCAAEISLVSERSVVESLSLLRAFRDDVLLSSSVGPDWVEHYEANRLELAALLARDSALREQTRQTLATWLPLIEALVHEDQADPAILTEQHLDLASHLFDRYTEQGSDRLKESMAVAQELVAEGRQYTGMDIREAWREFNR